MTQSPAGRERIGLLGGTFDPVHVGHTALARSAEVALKLTGLRLIPTGQSWQKSGQRTPALHRREMLELATAAHPHWIIDDREIQRGGASYTVETLESLRADLGSEPALVLIMGSDQLHNLPTWHRYEEILTLAHIAVTQREQVRLNDFPDAVESLLTQHGRDALEDAPGGNIVFFRMPPVAVSSTGLRKALASGEPVNNLMSPAVVSYINEHQLYGTN